MRGSQHVPHRKRLGPLVLILLSSILSSSAAFSTDVARRLIVSSSVYILVLAMIGLRAGRHLAVRQFVAVAVFGNSGNSNRYEERRNGVGTRPPQNIHSGA